MADNTHVPDEAAELRGGRDNHLILATGAIIGAACIGAIWVAAQVFANVSGLHPGLLEKLMTVVNVLCGIVISAAAGGLLYSLTVAALFHRDLRNVRRQLRDTAPEAPCA